MRVYSRTVTVVAQNIPTLVGNMLQQCSSVLIQAPAANTTTVFFGDKNSQPFELRPEANGRIPVNQAKDVYIRGTPPAKITIGLV